MLSGISTRHISKIEKGVMNPSFEVMDQIASALGTSLDYFRMPNDDEDEKNIQLLTGLYKGCPKGFKKLMISTMQTLSKEIQEADDANNNKEGDR